MEEDIKNAFQFRSDIEEGAYGDYVGVHVRRGDYLLDRHIKDVCNLDYYKKAFDLCETLGNVKYLVFSDDIDLCKKMFDGSNFFFYEPKEGEPDWMTLAAMSKCRANIISNSTFSWWGAYLNNNSLLNVQPKFWSSDPLRKYNEGPYPQSKKMKTSRWMRI